MPNTDNEQGKETSKDEHKTNDYVTRADLEATLAKYLSTAKTTKEEGKTKEADKSDVVAIFVGGTKDYNVDSKGNKITLSATIR